MGEEVGFQTVPAGDHILAATCQGSNAAIGPPVSYTLPGIVLTVNLLADSSLSQVHFVTLSGDVAAIVDVEASKIEYLEALRWQLCKVLFPKTFAAQHPQ